LQTWIFDIRSRTFILLVIAFLVITAMVFFKITEQFDQNTVLAFQSVAGDPFFDLVMQAFTEIGDVYYMLIFSVALLIIKRTRKIGLALMILLVLTTLLTGYVKCGVDRDRPSSEFSGTAFPIPIDRDTFALFCDGSLNASYPSGHAARAAVFGIIFGFVLSERFPRGCYLMLLYPFLMSLSRVYILQHFPMDVVGGVILGILLSGVIAKRTKLSPIFSKSKT